LIKGKINTIPLQTAVPLESFRPLSRLGVSTAQRLQVRMLRKKIRDRTNTQKNPTSKRAEFSVNMDKMAILMDKMVLPFANLTSRLGKNQTSSSFG